MKCKYSLTFEFEVSQPTTVKGESKGTSVRTVAARALDDAVEKHPGVSWSSLVLVLEREDEIPVESVKEKDE